MTPRTLAWGVLAVLILAAGGFCIWLAMLPTDRAFAAPAISQAEAAATVAALEPAGDRRPLIAVIGLNDATETTDYLMPVGILRRADIADVVMLATAPGPVQLFPALAVQPDSTTADFDAQHPDGADYVIVPAMSHDDDPVVLSWLQQQSAKGAIVIGICAGAKVVAAAGLLDGKQATTHWFYRNELLKRHPSVRYVPDRRLVVDGRVATTTGITASMPMMLTLIEAIAGRDKAEAVARDLGVEHWDARHASDAFRFTRGFATGVMGNVLAFWRREQLGIPLEPGMDEVSLALVADAWSRTFRSRALTIAPTAEITTEHGLRIVPDRIGEDAAGLPPAPTFFEHPPADALDNTLAAIAERYGQSTTDIVAMQLEYPR